MEPIDGRAAPFACLLASLALAMPLPAAAQYTTVSIPALVEGSLDTSDPAQGDGTYYERYVFPCRAGVTYAITLRSNDFDAYLAAAVPESTEWLKDDDGAGGTDSAIQLTPQTSGTCQAVATSYRVQTGRFVLGVSLGTEDLTVPSLDEVVAAIVARAGTEVVAWEVDTLNRANPVGVGGLNLEAGVAYSAWVIFEGNAPPTLSELRFTLFTSPSLETLRSTNVVPSMAMTVDGFQSVTWQFVAPPTPRGQTLSIMLARQEGDFTSRPAAMVLRRLPG